MADVQHAAESEQGVSGNPVIHVAGDIYLTTNHLEGATLDNLVNQMKGNARQISNAATSLDKGQSANALPLIWGGLCHLIGERFVLNRYKQAIETAVDAHVYCVKQGIDPDRYVIPLKTLLPLLHHASVETDPSLRERWVKLLASAASGQVDLQPRWIKMLANLSPIDAVVLEEAAQMRGAFSPGMVRNRLKHEQEAIEMSLENLVSLGLVREERRIMERSPGGVPSALSNAPPPPGSLRLQSKYGLSLEYSMTRTGKAFLQAVQGPQVSV